MKKKIINGLLFAVVLVAATSSFVSCKDYDGYNELNEKYLTLQDAFNKQVAAMNDYVLTSKYNSEVGANYDVNKGTIKARLDEIEDELDPSDPTSLAWQVHKNSEAIASLGDTLHQFVFMWGDDLKSALTNAGKAKQIALSYDTDTAKINQAIKNAQDIADKAWNYVNKGLAKDKDGNTKEDFQAWVKYFEDADAALAEDIASLKKDVNNILALVQQQVTGIEIQGTVNPIYGTFAYPVGVQSNILATYYGEFDKKVYFPAGDLDDGVWANEVPAILNSELKEIGAPEESFEKGINMNENNGNAGWLYLTVNPSDVVMDGKEFTLRTSDNQVSKVVLSPLASCTDQLKWGFKRAAENSPNGFYAATATIKKENVKDVALSFDMQSLKSQVKDIMNDWSSASPADIAKLGLAVLNGMQANLPRLGVQAQWKDTLGWKNYVSKYDLAAFSAKPVGYDFLYNSDFSPSIVKLKNKIIAKEKAISQEVIKEIADAIKIQIGMPTTSGNVKVVGNNVYIVMPANSVNISGNANYTIPAGAFAAGVPATAYPIIATVSASNPDEIELDITSVFNAIKNGIEQSIAGIDDKAAGIVNKVLNKVINVENKVFGKVISVAQNPNRYIQPALIARSEQLGYFYPSRTHIAPTQIKKGTKIMFYPTTLTGEVVAPAFKKYVAVCGAWEINDMSKTKDAKAFNTGDVMNKVIDGNSYNMSTPFEYTIDAPAGTVLEIIYETLGYNGKVAGKKYYIEVFE